MQWMIDRYNHDWVFGNPLKALATVLVTFLQLHPFQDGNGRTSKLIVYYVLKTLDPTCRLSFVSYTSWCQHLRDEHQLYLWLNGLCHSLREVQPL